MASILGAALAPAAALALLAFTGGSPVLVGVYLSVAAVITLVALIISKETRDMDYEA